jgi:hypothetical protein
LFENKLSSALKKSALAVKYGCSADFFENHKAVSNICRKVCRFRKAKTGSGPLPSDLKKVQLEELMRHEFVFSN